jgi:Tol biopolymer transport system component
MQLFHRIAGLKPEEREKELGEYRLKVHKELATFLKELLKDDQLKRLRQIELQQEGALALVQPEIEEELNISDEQRQRFAAMIQQMQTKLEPLIQEAQKGGKPEEIRPKILKVRKDHEDMIEAILYNAQRKQWKEMLGRPLELSGVEGRRLDRPLPSTDFGSRNGLIALTLRDRNGRLQISSIHTDGSDKKQLTTEGDNGRPAWSPDGKTIAFMSIRDGKKPAVWVMNADGAEPKFLAEGLTPDWSPNGKLIAFASFDAQIHIMNADGGNQRQITKSNTHKVGPSWSPDGKSMVFILIKNPGVRSDIQPTIGIMNADGTNERILTTEDRTNIKLNSDGTRSVLGTAKDANAPSWSPVGNKIAFWSGIEGAYGQVWTINADGTGSQQLTDAPKGTNNDDPAWSPDGKWILFGTNRGGKNELWVTDAEGKNQARISDLDADPFPGKASWQPVSRPQM